MTHEQLEAKVERLREALIFYANKENYEIEEEERGYYNTNVEDDYGQRARDAIRCDDDADS